MEDYYEIIYLDDGKIPIDKAQCPRCVFPVTKKILTTFDIMCEVCGKIAYTYVNYCQPHKKWVEENKHKFCCFCLIRLLNERKLIYLNKKFIYVNK